MADQRTVVQEVAMETLEEAVINKDVFTEELPDRTESQLEPDHHHLCTSSSRPRFETGLDDKQTEPILSMKKSLIIS